MLRLSEQYALIHHPLKWFIRTFKADRVKNLKPLLITVLAVVFLLIMRFVKVKGQSMLPQYAPGQYLIVTAYRFRAPRVGDDVVFTHQDFGLSLKRIERIEDNQIYLQGLNSLSANTSSLGTLRLEEKEKFERVIFKLPKFIT